MTPAAATVRTPFATGRWEPRSGEALRLGGPELTGRAIRHGGWHPGAAVLDLGCGRGESLGLLRARGLAATGVDTAEAALAEARRLNPDIAAIAADGAVLPFGGGAFDGVLAECSLSLMPDLPGVLAEIRRVLASGGCLVATDLFRRDGGAEPGPLPPCLHGLRTREDWQLLLENGGFRLEFWEEHPEVLKQFVGRIIFAGGSLRDIWAGSPEDADGVAMAMHRIRPGYALFVARRCVDRSIKEDIRDA